MRTSKLLRGVSIPTLLCCLCAAAGFAQNPPFTPVPLITQVIPPSLSPANLTPGSNGLTLTIQGANFEPNELVMLSAFGSTAYAFNPAINATGTQITANFSNVYLPIPATLTVTVVKMAVTGGILAESNPYYLPVTPSAQTAVLNTGTTSFLPGSPSGMAAADFNRDGLPDLAVISQVSNTVSILTANLGGGFTSGASYPTGNQPSGVVAADFNGDQVPDLAVTNASDNTVTIFLGNGDGTFRLGSTVSDPGVFPTQLVAADFNGDGKIDLAVLNMCGTGQNGCAPTAVPNGPGNVAMLLGNGDGTFTVAPVLPATGNVPTAIAAADLNADGFIDLIVANSSNNLTLLMGNGDGTFSAAASTPTTGLNGPPLGIAIGDFNGDGAPDVAVTSSGDNAVSILINQNCAGHPWQGCSLTPTAIPALAGTSPSAIATADMNADGILDLVVTNFGDGTVSLLLGDGTGVFTATGPLPAKSFATGGSPQALALIDFNQDGRLDVVTVNGSGSYTLLSQMAVGQLTLTSSNPSPFYGMFLTLTATVNPAFGQPTPTGTVTFYDGNTSLGSAVLSGYQAIFQFATLNAGTHHITAVYNGDGNFLPSTSNAVTETVTQAQTTMTLASNANSVPFGQPFTLSATAQPQTYGTPTGTVDFLEIYTSTYLGSAILVNGVAQFTLSNLSPGAHVIRAVYEGDSNFTGSSSPTYQENITQATTTVSVTTSASPVLLGQTPTFTATVQPSASTAAAGAVLFFADGSPTPLGSATVTNNTAQLRAPVLSAGPHSIYVQYTGDTNYTGSTSSPILEMVNPDADTVSVSANPIVYGQQATLVATVQAVNYSGTPTGTITFSDGSAILGMATLSNGSARFAASGFVVAAHPISASYSGDANFQPATSSQTTEYVLRANTTTAVTSAQNPSSFGQPVQLTATVQPAYGGAATGNVTFYDGSQSLGTSPLSNNTAVLGVSNFTVGAHSITASYVGDSNVNGSASAAATQTVTPSPTSVTLTSNANPSAYGQNATFTATAQAAFGTAPPSTISFYDGTTLLGAFNTVTSAQITISTFTAGTHSITAQYAGNSNFASSTSATLTQTVNPASTTTTVWSNLNPSSFGQPVTLTAMVDSTYHFTSNGGTVTFYDNGVAIGSSVMVGNGVTLTISSLGTGADSITASYGGDSNLLASTSAVFTQTVNPAIAAPTIGLSSYAITYGQTITMTSNVKPAYSGTPTGTVTFWLNWPTTALGTGTIVNGTAQATTTAVPVGSRSIYATYNGDANFASGNSLPTQLTISQASTTTAASADLNPANYGQTVTLSATVQSTGGTPTGSVTFLDGTTTLGTVTLANGVAQLPVSTFGGGSHSITAKYSGDANFSTSTSAVFAETVNLLPTTTAVASNLNPATFGQAVTLTATVQAGSGISVAGTVTFLDGSLGLGTVTLSNNSAQLTTSTLAPGAHILTTVYNSNGNFAGSTSAALTETVNQLTTTTTLASTANPALAGQGVTFTATVQAGAGNSPVGTVTFLDGSTTLGSAAVTNNSAQLTISTLVPGSHSITAAYSGSTNFAGSTSAALTETINLISTTTSLASSANPALAGQSVTFTATVQAGAGNSPTGSVNFMDGSTTLGTVTLANNSAQLTVSTLAAGSHSVTVVYSGGANFAGSTSGILSQTINQATTTTALTTSPNPSVVNQWISFVVTVSPATGGTPTGTVTLMDGPNTLSTATLSSGVGRISYSGLLPGTHSITAVYSGDANFAASTSAAQNVTVNQASTTTSVSSSLNPATYGQVVTFTASVQAPQGLNPFGMVTFTDGSTTLGSASLSNGSAQLTLSGLAAGSHSITAAFGGDTYLTGSTSAALSQSVSMASSVTTVSSIANPATFGQAVVLSVSIQDAFGGSATGTVTFLDGGTALGTAPVAGNAAQLSVSSLAVGSHSITAKYNGDANVAGSTSAALTETVNLLPTTTAVASNLNPATFGQAVTLTAAVQAGSGISVAGTVTFLDGSLGLGTVTLANSSAQLTTSTLAPGAHTLTAVYNSNGDFAGSTSATLTETVNQLTTTTTLASTANPALAGQSVTFTATVQGGAGNSPVGTVTFLDGSTTLGSAAVTNNSAQLTISTLVPGSHSITAAYGGSTDFAASTSSALSETVNQSGTTTTLVSNLNPATFGQAVPFVATVQTASGGAATGTVTFFDGATALGTASVSNSGGRNVAQLTFSGLLGGTHTITASYSGDANYIASTSSALMETVNPASSTVTVGASANPASFGQAVILTAAVVPSVSGTLATGTVTFFDGSSSLGTANLSNNAAQISVANFGLGSHSITATYAGDRNFAGSTSAALAEAVNPAPTATVVTSSANPAIVKSNVTFTATVSSSIAGTQSGTVNFYLDGSGTAAATVNLSNGMAQYSTNSLSAGSHSVVAVFTSSNPDFSGSTSAAFTQFISDFTVAVSPSSLTVARGTSGTYTLTLTPVGEFSGTVSLSCGGAPGGTTCAISPTQVTLSGSGSAQATVTITAAQNASKGTHTLTFTGTSGGVNHKVTANLTID